MRRCHGECTDLLFKYQQEEIRNFFQKDATVPRMACVDRCSLLHKAVTKNDVRAVRVLSVQGKAMVSNSDLMGKGSSTSGKKFLTNLELILRKLYSADTNVRSWSRKLHWSFPRDDRCVINWIWHGVAQQQCRDCNSPPPEVWLNTLSFIGRGLWVSLSPFKESVDSKRGNLGLVGVGCVKKERLHICLVLS